MDDARIIDLYVARDEQAIRETDSKYGNLCRHIACRILHDRDDAEECVNDGYLGVWNAIPPARPQHLKAFVCRITRNQALKRLEFLTRKKRSADVLLSLEELEGVLSEGSVADASEEDLGEIISRFLRTQKTDARNVFIRRYYFFDPVSEIAVRYAFTESKVKNMLLRTRKKLKEYLKKEGVDL